MQIGDGNTNIHEVSQADEDGSVVQIQSVNLNDEDEETTVEPSKEKDEETTPWNKKMEILNQIADTTTIENLPETTEIPRLMKKSEYSDTTVTKTPETTSLPATENNLEEMSTLKAEEETTAKVEETTTIKKIDDEDVTTIEPQNTTDMSLTTEVFTTEASTVTEEMSTIESTTFKST